MSEKLNCPYCNIWIEVSNCDLPDHEDYPEVIKCPGCLANFAITVERTFETVGVCQTCNELEEDCDCDVYDEEERKK